jgi:TRAP-type C4-dicarboxylate transport system permease small subunit
MKALALFDRLTGSVAGFLTMIGAVAIVLLMLHVVIDVTGRYLFNHPFPGTIEAVSYYYMVILTALPFAYVTRSQGQISVEMFTSGLPKRWVCLFEAIAGVLTLIYVCVMAWKIGQEADTMTAIGEVHDAGTMQFVTWPSRWVPPIAFGVMACAVVLRLVEDIKGVLRP